MAHDMPNVIPKTPKRAPKTPNKDPRHPKKAPKNPQEAPRGIATNRDGLYICFLFIYVHIWFPPPNPLLTFKENRGWPEGTTASGTSFVSHSLPAVVCIYIYIWLIRKKQTVTIARGAHKIAPGPKGPRPRPKGPWNFTR